jgi:hypothetical protein
MFPTLDNSCWKTSAPSRRRESIATGLTMEGRNICECLQTLDESVTSRAKHLVLSALRARERLGHS